MSQPGSNDEYDPLHPTEESDGLDSIDLDKIPLPEDPLPKLSALGPSVSASCKNAQDLKIENKPSDSLQPKLSKIQMLILNKTKELKSDDGPQTASPSTKMTKGRTNMMLGIGRALTLKNSPNDKVKFSVIKANKPSSLFNLSDDSEDELTSKRPKALTPPKPVLSQISKSIAPDVAEKVCQATKLLEEKLSPRTVGPTSASSSELPSQSPKPTPPVSSKITPPKSTSLVPTATLLPTAIKTFVSYPLNAIKKSYEADSTIPDEKSRKVSVALYSDDENEEDNNNVPLTTQQSQEELNTSTQYNEEQPKHEANQSSTTKISSDASVPSTNVITEEIENAPQSTDTGAEKQISTRDVPSTSRNSRSKSRSRNRDHRSHSREDSSKNRYKRSSNRRSRSHSRRSRSRSRGRRSRSRDRKRRDRRSRSKSRSRYRHRSRSRDHRSVRERRSRSRGRRSRSRESSSYKSKRSMSREKRKSYSKERVLDPFKAGKDNEAVSKEVKDSTAITISDVSTNDTKQNTLTDNAKEVDEASLRSSISAQLQSQIEKLQSMIVSQSVASKVKPKETKPVDESSTKQSDNVPPPPPPPPVSTIAVTQPSVLSTQSIVTQPVVQYVMTSDGQFIPVAATPQYQPTVSTVPAPALTVSSAAINSLLYSNTVTSTGPGTNLSPTVMSHYQQPASASHLYQHAQPAPPDDPNTGGDYYGYNARLPARRPGAHYEYSGYQPSSDRPSAVKSYLAVEGDSEYWDYREGQYEKSRSHHSVASGQPPLSHRLDYRGRRRPSRFSRPHDTYSDDYFLDDYSMYDDSTYTSFGGDGDYDYSQRKYQKKAQCSQSTSQRKIISAIAESSQLTNQISPGSVTSSTATTSTGFDEKECKPLNTQTSLSQLTSGSANTTEAQPQVISSTHSLQETEMTKQEATEDKDNPKMQITQDAQQSSVDSANKQLESEDNEIRESAASRRRSSRIQRKEVGIQAEKKIKQAKEQGEVHIQMLPDSQDEEETVDFVVDNQEHKSGIPLPSQNELQSSPSKPTTPTAPGKLKLRWLQASKQETEDMVLSQESSETDNSQDDAALQLKIKKISQTVLDKIIEGPIQGKSSNTESTESAAAPTTNKEPAYFDRIEDNLYLTSASKKANKKMKEAKRMVCDCSTSAEERVEGVEACGADCLNRMLMIECGSRCPCGDYCTNKRFQRHLNAPAEIFLTDLKGHGLKAKSLIPKDSFIREYVGEVLGLKDFRQRVKQYARDHNRHYYFMALNADEVIDATQKGNISRFINHSCDPNAETQKWTVNGKLRIGFFATRDIEPGEEITFDYQFERYGKEAQKCYCGSANCRGYIGGEKTQPLKPLHTDKVNKKKKDETRKKDYEFNNVDTLPSEIDRLANLGGLKTSQHVLQLSRLMVKVDSIEQRTQLTEILLDTNNQNCLRLFLSYHGLSLLWSWMVDLPNEGCYELKLMIINVLGRLPIANRNIIQDTKVLNVIERWTSECKQKFNQIQTQIKLETENKSGHLKEEGADRNDASIDSEVPTSTATQEKKSDVKPEISAEDKLETLESEDNNPKSVVKPDQDQAVIKEEPMSSVDNGDGEKDVTGDPELNTNQELPHDEKPCTSAVEPVAPTQGDTSLKSEIPSYSISLCSSDVTGSDNDNLHSEATEINTGTEAVGVKFEAIDEKAEDSDARSLVQDDDSQDGCASQDGAPMDDTIEGVRTAEQDLAAKLEDLDYMIKQLEDLLESWSQLKESFKIPKKQENEERKRTEHEIDTTKHEEFSEKIDTRRESQMRGRHGEKHSKKRRRDISPEQRHSRRRDEWSSHSEYSRPTLSKEERRRMFEEQVRAEEEQIEYERQQQLEYERQRYEQEQYERQQQQINQLQAQAAQQVYYQADGQLIPAQQLTYTQLPQSVPGYQLPTLYTQHIDQPVTQALSTQAPPIQLQQASVAPVQSATSSLLAGSLPVTSQSQAQTLCYYTTPQGIVVQQILQAAPTQANQVVYMPPTASTTFVGADEPPPPPAEPKRTEPQLPANWKSAKDAQGRTYYYHQVTRQTQWDFPTGSEEIGAEMEIESPPQKKQKAKHSKKATMAAADTSADAKKIKEQFKSGISVHIRTLLNSYMKSDCKVGKISNKDDYKFLAKKLTHAVMDKELKHCRHHEDLEVNENVKFKAKEFVKKYMAKSGAIYKRDKDEKIE